MNQGLCKGSKKNEKHFFCYPASAGLTLTEVIVAVAILATMVVVIIAGFSSYAHRQAFNQYVNEVELSIKEQRQKTLASENDAQYGIYIGTTTVQYFEGISYSPSSPSSTEQSLPNSITATSSFSDSNWYVTFSRLTGEASATGTITLIDSKTLKSATITISSLGLIE